MRDCGLSFSSRTNGAGELSGKRGAEPSGRDTLMQVLCAQACSLFAVHILGATACFAGAALYALVQCALTQLVHHSAALNPHLRRARAPLVADSDSTPALPPLLVAIDGAQHYGAVSDPPLPPSAMHPSRERPALASAALESDSPSLSASASASASSAHRDALCSLHTSRGARLLHALRCLLVLLLLLLVPLGASLVPAWPGPARPVHAAHRLMLTQ